MAILHDQGRHPLTVSPLFPASLSVCFVAPSAACDESAGAVIDANDGLQIHIDELRTRQAQFAQLGQTVLPDLGDADPAQPRLIGSLLRAPTLVQFQRRMQAFARRCGHRAQRTEHPLDSVRRGAGRWRALTASQEGRS